METSDSLGMVVGRVGVFSFDVEVSVVGIKYLSLCLDVVGVDDVDTKDGVFDGIL